jgi:hypothetical protein
MSGSFKPAGVVFASVVAGLGAGVGADLMTEADRAAAAREAEADALNASIARAAAQFAPAEPFSAALTPAPEQGDLFDL